MINKLTIIARILPDGQAITVVGRNAWALRNLVNAGAGGCTPINHPGPRWSHYVYRLRRSGFLIETFDEKHGGPFSGVHARYILRSPVEILKITGDRRAE